MWAVRIFSFIEALILVTAGMIIGVQVYFSMPMDPRVLWTVVVSFICYAVIITILLIMLSQRRNAKHAE